MNEKQPNLPVITNELLEALDKLFPERTPEIKHGAEGNVF